MINKNIKKIKPVNIGLVDIEFMKKTENNFLRYPSPLEHPSDATEKNKHILLKLKELNNKYLEDSNLNHEKQVELLKDSSEILKKLSSQPDIIKRMETTNYRIAYCLALFDYTTIIIFENLNAGICNLLHWEYDIMGKYDFSKDKDGNSCVSYSKVTIIFEDELEIQNSPQYLNNYINKERVASLMNSFDKKTRFEIDEEGIGLFADSSLLIRYLDDDTLNEIGCGRRFQITVDVDFSCIEQLSVKDHMHGLGSLLIFERWLWKKCLEWKSDNYYNEEDFLPFSIKKIDICFEL